MRYRDDMAEDSLGLEGYLLILMPVIFWWILLIISPHYLIFITLALISILIPYLMNLHGLFFFILDLVVVAFFLILIYQSLSFASNKSLERKLDRDSPGWRITGKIHMPFKDYYGPTDTLNLFLEWKYLKLRYSSILTLAQFLEKAGLFLTKKLPIVLSERIDEGFSHPGLYSINEHPTSYQNLPEHDCVYYWFNSTNNDFLAWGILKNTLVLIEAPTWMMRYLVQYPKTLVLAKYPNKNASLIDFSTLSDIDNYKILGLVAQKSPGKAIIGNF